VERGGRPVDPITQPAEALEPAEGALDDRARALECDVLGIQRARCRRVRRDVVGMSAPKRVRSDPADDWQQLRLLP